MYEERVVKRKYRGQPKPYKRTIIRMKMIPLLVPKSWFPMIDKCRGEQARSVWLRDLIRDELKRKGLWNKKDKSQPKK